MPAELQALRRDSTLILTLSNPGLRNALDPAMCAAAIESLTTAERDKSIQSVILTGANNFFCAGDNLKRLLDNRTRDKQVQIAAIDQLNGCIEAIRGCPKPVIAAVDGGAIGAGFSLAMACDLIVAGEAAQFSIPHVKVGLTPEGGASWFLTQTLPRQLVTEILIEGKPVLASRLHQLGLVNRLVPDGSALAAALGWADHLAVLSQNAVQRIKILATEAQTNTLSDQYELEKHHFVESLHHRDAHEGLSAFLEKRKPHYR